MITSAREVYDVCQNWTRTRNRLGRVKLLCRRIDAELTGRVQSARVNAAVRLQNCTMTCARCNCVCAGKECRRVDLNLNGILGLCSSAISELPVCIVAPTPDSTVSFDGYHMSRTTLRTLDPG